MQRGGKNKCSQNHVMVSFTCSKLPPYPSSDPQLQFLSIATRESQGQVPLDYKSIMAVTDAPVVGPNAPRHTLPYQLPPITANLKAIPKFPRIRLLTYEAEECHVDWFCSKPKSFKMEAKVVSKAVEELHRIQRRIRSVENIVFGSRPQIVRQKCWKIRNLLPEHLNGTTFGSNQYYADCRTPAMCHVLAENNFQYFFNK